MVKKTNIVTSQQINKIFNEGKVETFKLGKKTTAVLFTTKEGFEIISTSACVDEANYDEILGKTACLNKIKDKLYELEGYCLQKQLTLTPVNEIKKEQPKIEFTIDELFYLKCLPKEVKYLARDDNGELFAFEFKPRKVVGEWLIPFGEIVEVKTLLEFKSVTNKEVIEFRKYLTNKGEKANG